MKKRQRRIIKLVILIIFPITLCGCWDYVQMQDVALTLGIAIDKDMETNDYIFTVEMFEESSDKESVRTKLVQSREKTIHSALRDAIKSTGKQLQVSHMKIVIVSKEIAYEGIEPVLDLLYRDAEVRDDMYLVISNMDTAAEILTENKKDTQMRSYEIVAAVKNSDKVGKYKSSEVFSFIDALAMDGTSATTSMIKIINDGKNDVFQVSGTAVFKKDKMVGMLNEEDSLIFQFLSNKKLKFVFPVVLENNDKISLEMMSCYRKIKPRVQDGKISMDMYVEINAALSELNNVSKDYVDKSGREEVKKATENYIKSNAEKLITKLKKEYKSDIIGFGSTLSKKNLKEWSKVSENWNEAFQTLDVNVFVKVNIKYSALTNKYIETRD